MSWEVLVRAGSFAGLLLLFALWEWLTPRRGRTARRAVRWASNLGLIALSSAAVPLILPVASMAMAYLAAINRLRSGAAVRHAQATV